MSDVFSYDLTVRYYEVDAQGVVFNMWYLGYFDEAFSAFLEHRGLPYRDMIAAGFDAQLVHTELDWTAPARWGDAISVSVSTAAIGRTSFTLLFEAYAGGGALLCRARTVYVAIAADGSGKRPIPPSLLTALGQPVG